MPTEIKKKIELEVVHVLFLDIVGYSRRLTNEQQTLIDQLNQVVRSSEEFQNAEAAGRLIKIPTGDGMALVFYKSPAQPVECALEISRALKTYPELRVRMGVHSGPVSAVTDLNDRTNAAGIGINIAQRVMDCGDAGHILVSKRFADDLAQHRRWQRYLHELGDVKVKHGVVVSLVNLYAETIGNPAPPACVAGVPRTAPGATTRKGLSPVPRAVFIIAALLLTLAIVSVIFAPAIMRSVDKNRATSAPQPSATASPSLSDAIQNMVKQRITDELQKGLSGKSNAPTPRVTPIPKSQPMPPPPP